METKEVTTLIIGVIFLLGFFGLFIVMIFLLFKHKQIKAEQKIAELSAASLMSQVEMQENTLKKTGKELHDNIGQMLALANLNLSSLSKNQTEPDQTRIKDTKAILLSILHTIRNLSKGMNSDKVLEIGLVESLRKELQMIESSGVYKTTFTTNTNELVLPNNIAIILYRIIQEGLHNIISHSNAKNIDLCILRHQNICSISIKDDGSGFDYLHTRQTKNDGQGLKNMESRTKLLKNGNITFISKKGDGTEVLISFTI